MYLLRRVAFLLTVASAAAALAQAPATNRPTDPQARAYTNRVQFYDVDLNLDNPQEKSTSSGAQRDDSYNPLDDAAVPSPNILPAPQRPKPVKQRAADKDKKKGSGWGWLADDVAKSEKKAGKEGRDNEDAAAGEDSDTGDDDTETHGESEDQEATPREARPRELDAFYAPDRSGRYDGLSTADRAARSEKEAIDGRASEPSRDQGGAAVSDQDMRPITWAEAEAPSMPDSGPAFGEVTAPPQAPFGALSFEPSIREPTDLPGAAFGGEREPGSLDVGIGSFSPITFEPEDGDSAFGGGGIATESESGLGGLGIDGAPGIPSSESYDFNQPKALPW